LPSWNGLTCLSAARIERLPHQHFEPVMYYLPEVPA
jgi:hypothetical protein